MYFNFFPEKESDLGFGKNNNRPNSGSKNSAKNNAKSGGVSVLPCIHLSAL